MRSRKLLTALLALCMVITLLPVSAFADTEDATSGSCGENVSWSLNGDRLCISGTGAMDDFTQGNTPWNAYQDIIYGVEISSGVTYIGDYAFYGMDGLYVVAIPEGLTGIGDYAFSNCPGIQQVTLPDTVTAIGTGAFQNSSQANVLLGDFIQSIGDSAFEGTAKLAANLPDSVTSIGNRAFADCPKLWLARFHENVQTIGKEAFSGCSALEEIYFNGNVPSIGEDAFADVSAIVYYLKDNSTWTETARQNYGGDLTYVAVNAPKVTGGNCGQNGYDVIWTLTEDGTLTISGSGPMVDINSYSADSNGDYVYAVYWRSYYDQIKTVVIEEGVTYIGDHNFYGASQLTSVIIADSVTEIGTQVFSNSPNLKDITFGSGLAKTGIEIFSNCDALTSVTLPDTDVDYGSHMFTDCDNLKSVTIPESQTSLGSYMFEDCGNLTQIHIPDSVTSIGGYAFAATHLTSIDIPDSVTALGPGVFYNCDYLKKIEIPSGVTEIADKFFWHCDSLTEVILPTGITTIGTNVFAHCNKLTEVTVPYTVTKMRHSFQDAYGLETITFLGNAPDCGDQLFGHITVTVYYPSNNNTWTESYRQDYGGTVTWIGYISDLEFDTVLASGTCGDDLTWTLTDEYVLIISGTGDMYDYRAYCAPWYDYASRIEAIEIESGVTSIGENALMGCKAVQTAAIADTVTSIGAYSFQNCSALTELTIPANVASIGNGAFIGCSSMENIIFCGDAPAFGSMVFWNITITAYYPAGNDTWTADVMQNYDGEVTWVASAHDHEYEAIVTAPTCTAQGYTTHTCTICGDNYADSYVDPLGHDHSYELTKAPTAEETGTLTGTCSRCTETVTVDLPALNTADYTYTVISKPTETEDGAAEYTWNVTDYGTVTIYVTLAPLTTDFLLGDVNGDGNVNTVDAMLVLQYAVGMLTADELILAASDANQDGTTNTIDAMLILQYAVGLVTALPVT